MLLLDLDTMSDKDSDVPSLLFSPRSVPRFGDTDYDSQDEIVLFDEDDEIHIVEEDEYDYQAYGDLFKAKDESERIVTFIRSSKDSNGNFFRERKSYRECIESGCEEAEPGVYAPQWYFTYLFGEKQGKSVWSESAISRRVRELGGKAIKIDDDIFESVLSERERGNRSFQRAQYNTALQSYLKAERLVGIPGIYLDPEQRDELVKILSNQAECYLRMNKYEDAKEVASAALQLDKKHRKSILRRAKAVYHCAKRHNDFDSNVAAQAKDDLEMIITEPGGGAEEAKTLIVLINDQLKKALKSQ